MKIGILGAPQSRGGLSRTMREYVNATGSSYADYRQIGPTSRPESPSLNRQRSAVQRTLLQMAYSGGDHLEGDNRPIRTGVTE